MDVRVLVGLRGGRLRARTEPPNCPLWHPWRMTSPGAPPPPQRWGPVWAKVLACLSLLFPLALVVYGIVGIVTGVMDLAENEGAGDGYTGLGVPVGMVAITLAVVMALPGALFVWKRGAVFFIISMIVLAISVRAAVALIYPGNL